MDSERNSRPNPSYDDAGIRHEPEPIKPLHWPWLLMIGLAAFGFGVVCALLLG